jgi:hypothetical protein
MSMVRCVLSSVIVGVAVLGVSLVTLSATHTFKADYVSGDAVFEKKLTRQFIGSDQAPTTGGVDHSGATMASAAETLSVVCENDKGESAELLIDFQKKTVQQGTPGSCTFDLGARGKVVVPDCEPPGHAEISTRSVGNRSQRL